MTMSLLTLPPELRIQIFEYLPDLSYGRQESIGPNVRLTPAICRTTRTLREEALPIYAKTSAFVIQTDDNLHTSNNRVKAWLDALGHECIPKVESLQLSRHWKIKQPSRWEGHIGFYVRLQLVDREWQCTSGTYPFANDMRGMRLESVDLLRHVVLQRLRKSDPSSQQGRGMSRADVELIIQAMDVVASHPIPTFDTEQSEAGRRRRRETWTSMEKELLTVAAVSKESSSFSDQDRTFYTPY